MLFVKCASVGNNMVTMVIIIVSYYNIDKWLHDVFKIKGSRVIINPVFWRFHTKLLYYLHDYNISPNDIVSL